MLHGWGEPAFGSATAQRLTAWLTPHSYGRLHKGFSQAVERTSPRAFVRAATPTRLALAPLGARPARTAPAGSVVY